MSIIRAPRPQGNFYILNKNISEDPRLTWGARGLLIYLLGKPDHWQVSTAALVNETAKSRVPAGRDAIRALIGELIAAGYMKRQVARDEFGRVCGYDYTVSEDVAEQPETDKPAPGEPSPVEPAPANPPQVSTDSLVNTDSEASIEDAFNTFWTAGMVKTGKKPTFARFAAIIKKQSLDPAGFAARLAADVKTRLAAEQYGFDKLHPITYLNQERWNDEIKPPDKPASTHTGFANKTYVGTPDDEIPWANS